MRFFTPEPLPGFLLFPAFLFRFSPGQGIGGLFKDNLPNDFFKKAEFVSNISSADFVVLPNNFTYKKKESDDYIAKYADLAEKHRIPIFIFSCGDYTDRLKFDPRVFVFKTSLYKSSKSPREISLPTLTEDIGRFGVEFRKKRAVPVVGFCGKAGFSSLRERLVTTFRVGWYLFLSFFIKSKKAFVRGVYWRKKSIKFCRLSNLVESNFIIRKTFSGALRTIEVPPEIARKEFIENIKNSDFVLAPKGDGNYSNRFLETLSLGRIPVLIDTDVVLPFEDIIDYSKIVVRVSMNNLKNIPSFIRQYYDKLTEDEWMNRQKFAREVFEKYLRQDSFFAEFFTAFKK